METMDFSGATNLVQEIPSEKNIEQPQMMEFSSSVADLLPQGEVGGAYINPSNDKVSGLSMPDAPQSTPSSKRKGNPFNLTDEQLSALLAGLISVVVFSSTVQTKLAGTVPNFSGVNGSIASLLAAAILFFFAHRFIKNR
jgi:hypothetical protein